jgi:hypothetical protein
MVRLQWRPHVKRLYHIADGLITVQNKWSDAIAQAVSRWLPTAAVRGSKPDLGMWDLW